jgi:AcrR family transcriptional regulator
MSAEARKPYDIETLTNVAVRVFAERGYDGASMDDVARAAGITKASIYHHVTGKEALLGRGLRRALDALSAILEEPGSNRGSAGARLEHLVRRVAEVTFDLLPELSVLFRIRGNSPTELEALAHRRRFDRTVASLVRQAQNEGSVRSDIDPGVATRLIFGMSNSTVEWFRADGRSSPGELADAICKVALGGLKI